MKVGSRQPKACASKSSLGRGPRQCSEPEATGIPCCRVYSHFRLSEYVEAAFMRSLRLCEGQREETLVFLRELFAEDGGGRW